jgi:hypothetical protein
VTNALQIMGVIDGQYVSVGQVTIQDDGSLIFSDNTPDEVRAKFNSGLECPDPFAGRGILQPLLWLIWLMTTPTILIKAGDPLFEQAIKTYNDEQFQTYATSNNYDKDLSPI